MCSTRSPRSIRKYASFSLLSYLPSPTTKANIPLRGPAKTVLTKASLQLSRYPVLNNLERQTSVPKVYAFLGVAGIYVFLVFFNIAGAFLVNLAGFAIPGYYSLNALFTSSTADDTQVGSAILWLSAFFSTLPSLSVLVLTFLFVFCSG